MNLPEQHPFIPGNPPQPLPLSRFLPPLPEGMAAEWLRQNIPAGSWLIDPLGASPALAIEAARAGYRVLVSTNNPLLCFMTEILAQSPRQNELAAALSALAILRRGAVRLENELKALYETRCPGCERIVQADGYLWERDAAVPYACLYHCPACKQEGEHPVTEFDLEKLNSLGSHNLHHARALERVNVGSLEARQGAEEALKNCLPRQLYVISTLINKTASLNLEPAQKQLLHALILSVCDQGNTLWAWPSARSRPRQLGTPPRFRESNLWTAFESAIQDWQSLAKPIETTRWPQLPSASGGICIHSGRPGVLLTEPGCPSFSAVISVLPRPSQAFWTFSAMWSGWLWGPESVLPMKSALERRRYDWNWYADALFRLFRQMQRLPDNLPFLTILPELAPGFFGAAIISSSLAGLKLHSLALNPDEDLAQLVWKTAAKVDAAHNPDIQKFARLGMLQYLQDRGEPSRQMQLETASLAALACQGCLQPARDDPPSSRLAKTQKLLAEILTDTKTFGQAKDNAKPHPGQVWWPAIGWKPGTLPLADRVEKHLLEALLTAPALSEAQLFSSLYASFPGLLTPTQELVNTILNSYAHPVFEEPVFWQLNEQEQPENRRSELQQILEYLLNLGKALQYQTQLSERSVYWSDADRNIFVFHCFASSMIARFVQQNPPLDSGCQGVLVFPGSRSRLLAYKLLHNPVLSQAIEKKWMFLKYRHLRRFLEKETPDRSRWQEHLQKDPPMWEEPTQMSFFV